MIEPTRPIVAGHLRGPRGIVALGLVGLLAALTGWSLLGSAIGIGVWHAQRCGSAPGGPADPACQSPNPWALRGQLGAALLLVGVGVLAAAVTLALMRITRRRRGPESP